MRLTTQQQQILRVEVAEIFGRDVQLRLLGSRVDDNARGGDGTKALNAKQSKRHLGVTD